MRPVATKQDALRAPLNDLLSKEAHVRLLRALAANPNRGLTVSQLADEARLTKVGARNALVRLVETGYVLTAGPKNTRRYALDMNLTIAKSIVELFRVEERHYQEVIEALREAAQAPAPPAISVWVARLERTGAPLHVWAVHKPNRLSLFREDLQNRLREVERRFTVIVELHVVTRADVAHDPEAWTEGVLLAGVPLSSSEGKGRRRQTVDHEELDARLRRRAHILAELVQEDPSLIDRAREHLKRMLEKDQGTAQRDLEEWLQILEAYPLGSIVRFLRSNTERSTRLKQSSPFFSVLGSRERKRLSEADSLR